MVMQLFEDPMPIGLCYISDYLSPETCNDLTKLIDGFPWAQEIERRTQQFGFAYKYASGRVGEPGSAPAVPPQIRAIAEQLYADGIVPAVPDQVIINEYLVDENVVQGIAAHRDRVDEFGDVIVTISLVEEWAMRFTRDGHAPLEVLLAVGSVAALSGPARYEWEHSIPARKYDRVEGGRRKRNRRISLTFRNVVPLPVIGAGK